MVMRLSLRGQHKRPLFMSAPPVYSEFADRPRFPTQFAVQAPDHVERERAATVEYLRYPAAAAENQFKIAPGQPLLLHAELDGVDRIGRIDGIVRLLVSADEQQQDLAPIRIARTLRRLLVVDDQPIDFSQGRIVVCFGLYRSDRSHVI